MRQLTRYSKNDILTTLDMIATVKKFPVLDNVNNYMSDARLTTFFSPKDWLLLFEIVGYSAPENEFVDHIYLLGNCVANTVQMKEEIFVEETEENSVWDREEGKWLADWRKWEIMVRGKVYEFQPSLTEYKEAAVEIIKTEGGPGSLRQDMLIRYLSFKLGEELFCTDQELKDILPEKSFEKFLQFKEWRHPDIRNNELPSDIPFFLALCEALASGSKKLPETVLKNPNTHWTNWPVKWY